MTLQLLLALALSALTVLIHAEGTFRVVVPWCGLWKQPPDPSVRARPIATLIYLVSGLLMLHLVAAAIWALAYRLFGILPDFETAFYFSLTSYSTVGYGDVVPERTWRLLGPIEATLGILMLGLSTGILVAAVQRLYDRLLSTPNGQTPPDDR